MFPVFHDMHEREPTRRADGEAAARADVLLRQGFGEPEIRADAKPCSVVCFP